MSPFPELPFAHAYAAVIARAGEEESLSCLFPEERARVARAGAKRLREYRAGRHAARDALRSLGLGAPALPADDAGVPRFPQGVAGSISHCGRSTIFAAALVSRQVGALGLDVEERRELSGELERHIVTAEERAEMWGIFGAADYAIAVFSAKEAFYKCVFPRLRRVLGFHDVVLTSGSHGYLRGRLRAAGAPPGGAPGVETAREVLISVRREPERVLSCAWQTFGP